MTQQRLGKNSELIRNRGALDVSSYCLGHYYLLRRILGAACKIHVGVLLVYRGREYSLHIGVHPKCSSIRWEIIFWVICFAVYR